MDYIERERICANCKHPFWARRKKKITKRGPSWYYCPDCRLTKNQRTVNNAEYRRAYQQKTRLKALKHLAGEIVTCAKCGLSDIRILQIDHIHGGGNREFKNNPGKSLYSKIFKMAIEEARAKYQVLCPNCNWIKRVENNEVS